VAKEKQISEATVMVVDDGMFLEVASRLGRDFKEVLYYSTWERPYPKMNEGLIGYGMPNVTRVNSIWEHFDDVDLFVFPCTGFGDLQEHIESLGKRVWGSRRGEEMEIYRDMMKSHMKKLGLPVGKYEVLKGIEELREYLKKNDDTYVKINQWRGMFESFYSKNYKTIECKLDEIENILGPFKFITDFIVEESLPDKVEIGYDGYTIDGKYPARSIAGIEVKDLGYIGEVREYKDLPKEVTDFNTKISDTFKNYGYRGMFSTEIRVGKDKVPFMIDATCRMPSPPNELYQELYTNYSEIIWHGSNGEMVDPIASAKFGVQALIYSSWSEKHYLPIDIPADVKNQVKLMNAVMIKNQYYICPQDNPTDVIGSVIGLGDTLEKAIENMKDVAGKISAYDLDIRIGSMEKAQEQMDKLRTFGIKLFSK